jgi:hypothetical protein
MIAEQVVIDGKPGAGFDLPTDLPAPLRETAVDPGELSETEALAGLAIHL